MKTLLELSIGLLILSLMVLAISSAWQRQEIVDCNKLVAQSKEFKEAGFYITKWQDEMCRSHSIIIETKVI